MKSEYCYKMSADIKQDTFVTCNVHVKFPAGCPMMVAGPTGCGKTSWVQKLLTSKHNFTEPVRSVLYCYGVYQPRYSQIAKNIPNVTFHKGLPNKQTVDELKNPNYLDVLVLDDLMEYILDNIEAQTLFTKYCHHYNITTIFLTQNVLAQGRCARNISLNTLMLVMFQNHRDRNQALTMAKQQSPRNPDLFLQAFEDATQMPFGYLVIDCTPHCHNSQRWRTCIFKDNHTAPDGKCYIIQRMNNSAPPVVRQGNLLQSSKTRFEILPIQKKLRYNAKEEKKIETNFRRSKVSKKAKEKAEKAKEALRISKRANRKRGTLNLRSSKKAGKLYSV